MSNIPSPPSLPSPSSPPAPSSSSFRLHLTLRCGGLDSAHASLNTGLVFAHLAVILMVVSVFWLCLPSVCPVASYIQYLIHWPNTFYTPSLSKYGLFKPFSIWPFPKPWFTHMLWLKLKGWFEQNQCFLRQNRLLHKELFYTKTVLYTNTMFYTKAMFLLGLCKGCLRLTGWLFPWWLNTPKAVKYVQKLGQLFTTKSSG